MNQSENFNRSVFGTEFISSPVDCRVLKSLGLYTAIVFAASLVLNTTLLLIFYHHRSLCSSLNKFVISLTLFNLIGSILEYPPIIWSNFSCGWPFGYAACIFSGFVMYWVGCASIFLMVAISLERYLITSNPLSMQSFKPSTVYMAVAASTLTGLFWALLPLLGWSHYSLEGALTSCSVEWNERNFAVISYNLAMFLFVYFIPLAMIICTNYKLLFMVKDLRRVLISLKRDREVQRMVRFERKATINSMILIAGFFFSWTPYAIVTLYIAFIDSEGVSPLLATLPALFAKSSMLWPALYFILFDKKMKSRVNKNLYLNLFRPKRKSDPNEQEAKILNNRLYMRRMQGRRMNSNL
nr:G protein-coupled receptor [Proales similis]